MATLPTYQTFEEKAEHFHLEKVDTLEDYTRLVTRQQTCSGIYRGINSSKYKIYTSLQRQIITKDLQRVFDVKKYLDNFKNEEILKKYFLTFKIEPSKFSIYSYLQHYGAPTAFLDFTFSFPKALYFAIENFNELDHIDSGSLDDYFSVFFIDQSDLNLIEIPEVIKSLQEVKKLTYEALSHYEDYTPTGLVSFVDNILSINTLKVYLIRHHEEFVDIYNTYNNIRIIAQEGLFICNEYLDKPLEVALKEFFEDATVFIGSELDEIDDPQIIAKNEQYILDLEKNRIVQQKLSKNIIKSFEIRKSLIPEIIKTQHLQKGDIYPDPEKLCWDIFEKTIAS